MTWHYIEKWLISALSFVQVEHWTLQLRAWPVWGTLREGEGDVMQTSSQKKGLFNAPKMDWLLLLSSLAFTWTFFYHLPQWTNYFYYYGITFSFTLFFAGNAFLCILAVPNGPSGNLQRNKKKLTCIITMWNVYTCISHRAKLIWEWFSSLANPGAIVLSSWQDSLHHQLNGFSPNSGPQKKPLALLQAYLSCGQHTWTFYVGQKNSDKMLSSGRVVSCCHSLARAFLPLLLLPLCTYRCQAPLSGLSCYCPFFITLKNIIKSPREQDSECFCMRS